MVDYRKHLPPTPSLADRLASIRAKGAPSLVPTPKAERPPKVEEIIPDIHDIGLSKVLARRVSDLTVALAAQKRIERQAKQMGAPLAEAIKAVLTDLGKVKAQVGDIRLAYFSTTRVSISKALLLQQGVSPAVIAAASVPTESWSLKVSLPGVEEEDL